MAGYGTGYPLFFHCAKARRIYYGGRAPRSSFPEDVAQWHRDVEDTGKERAEHVVKLTGRTKPTRSNGKGHARKSTTTWEYECSCGHVGWSSHISLERMAKALDIVDP